MAAGPPVIDVEMGGGNLLHRVQNEVDDVPGGPPSRRSQGRNIGVWRSRLTKRAGMQIRSRARRVGSKDFQNILHLEARQAASAA